MKFENNGTYMQSEDYLETIAQTEAESSQKRYEYLSPIIDQKYPKELNVKSLVHHINNIKIRKIKEEVFLISRKKNFSMPWYRDS